MGVSNSQGNKEETHKIRRIWFFLYGAIKEGTDKVHMRTKRGKTTSGTSGKTLQGKKQNLL